MNTSLLHVRNQWLIMGIPTLTPSGHIKTVYSKSYTGLCSTCMQGIDAAGYSLRVVWGTYVQGGSGVLEALGSRSFSRYTSYRSNVEAP